MICRVRRRRPVARLLGALNETILLFRSAGWPIRLFEVPLVPFRQAHVASISSVIATEPLGSIATALASWPAWGLSADNHEVMRSMQEVILAVEAVESRVLTLGLDLA